MTLDAAALARELDLPNGTGTTPLDPAAMRLLAVASPLVTGYAPGAPDAISNEAVIRTAGYLDADSPELRTLRSLKVSNDVTLEPRATGSALRLSGAAALLAPYRTRRAGGWRDLPGHRAAAARDAVVRVGHRLGAGSGGGRQDDRLGWG